MMFFVFCLFIGISVSVDYGERGLPTSIDWKSYDAALEDSKTNGKPTLVLFTKTWCGACKNLKGDLVKNEASFKTASEKFNMVNIEEDSELPTDNKNFTPDGGYIPRVFFLTPEGNIDDTIVSSNARYKHFFANTDALVEAMNSYGKNPQAEEKPDL
jgi:protein-disulfide reductase (glutathione)